jgi:hypothetical protein
MAAAANGAGVGRIEAAPTGGDRPGGTLPAVAVLVSGSETAMEEALWCVIRECLRVLGLLKTLSF